ncbi:hypothetical protein WVI01_02070 [Weissella viridescens]|nr:hypothetical protein WVI01_02070 [Weissella viridescens]
MGVNENAFKSIKTKKETAPVVVSRFLGSPYSCTDSVGIKLEARPKKYSAYFVGKPEVNRKA